MANVFLAIGNVMEKRIVMMAQTSWIAVSRVYFYLYYFSCVFKTIQIGRVMVVILLFFCYFSRITFPLLCS